MRALPNQRSSTATRRPWPGPHRDPSADRSGVDLRQSQSCSRQTIRVFVVRAEYGQDSSALDSSGRARVPLVVSGGLGYKLWFQHNAVLSEDNEVFDPFFGSKAFFVYGRMWPFFYCHRTQ